MISVCLLYRSGWLLSTGYRDGILYYNDIPVRLRVLFLHCYPFRTVSGWLVRLLSYRQGLFPSRFLPDVGNRQHSALDTFPLSSGALLIHSTGKHTSGILPATMVLPTGTTMDLLCNHHSLRLQQFLRTYFEFHKLMEYKNKVQALEKPLA